MHVNKESGVVSVGSIYFISTTITGTVVSINEIGSPDPGAGCTLGT